MRVTHGPTVGESIAKRLGVSAKGKRRAGSSERGQMNRLETRYAEHLELRRAAGDVVWIGYEAATFRLTGPFGAGMKAVRYTPDFLVLRADGTLEAHEVKGFRDEKDILRLKVAASFIPLVFFLVESIPKREGGGWSVSEV